MRAITKLLGMALAACALIGLAAGASAKPKSEPYHWRNVKIVAGGFVTGIIFHPKERGLIYARTDMGGAYRYDARAKQWVPITDWVGAQDWTLTGIESLAVDPTDANRVYMAAGTYTNSWSGNGAILRSSDQGRTWQRTNMPFKFGGNEDGRSIGERLAVDPNQPSILYLGTRHDGLWKSADRGATWKKVDSFPITGRTNGIGIGFVLFDAASGQRGRPTPFLYAGVAVPGVTLYRSADGGVTWQEVPGQPKGFLPHHGVLTPDGTLYLTYGNGPGPNGMSDGAVWKLDTKSGAWTDITPLKPGTQNAGGFGFAGLSADASHPGTLVVTTMDKWSSLDDIFRTIDGGRTWKALGAKAAFDCSVSPYLKWGNPAPKLGWWMGSFAIDPFNPNHALYVTGATIWGTDDLAAADSDEPTHWSVRGEGVEQAAIQDLISPPVGAHLLSVMGDLGGFRHDDLDVSPREGMFTNPLFGSGTSIDFAEKTPDVIARAGNAGNGQKSGAISTDGGKSWTPFASEPEGSRGGGTIAVSADGGTLVWAANGASPACSRDHGASWTACAGLPRGLRVLSDRVNSQRFYAVDPKDGTLYASADAGATFTAMKTGVPVGQMKLRPSPVNEGDLWLSVENGGLYRSTDGGAHFAKLASVQSAETAGFGKAAPGKSYPAVYMAGRVDGVHGLFRSDDEGASWVRINDDRHQYAWIGQVIIGDPRVYGRVYMGTNGRGILTADPAN